MTEIYRRNAGIVVFNRDRKVLLCRRCDVADAWQFPQGGIEADETPAQAALRELKEETSLANVRLVKTLEAPVRYKFPPQVIRSMKARGFNNVGQEMYWSLCYFDGSDDTIDLKTAEPEFDAFRWGNLAEAQTLIVDFKKEAYAVAVKAFQPLIDTFDINN